MSDGRADDAPTVDDVRAALAALVADRARFVAFARTRCATAAGAEDIVHTAYEKALERSTTLHSASLATAWFFRILRNAIIDDARRRGARENAVAGAAREPAAPNDPRDRATPCSCVLAVLGGLRADYAGLIELVDLDGLAVTEAAGLLGITANNASVRLHRARRALRDGLAANCGQCSIEGCGDCSCHDGAG